MNYIYVAPFKLKDTLKCGQEHINQKNLSKRADIQNGGSQVVGQVKDGSFERSLDPANLSSGVMRSIYNRLTFQRAC